MLKSQRYKLTLVFRILYSLNHIYLPLSMLNKVNIAKIRPFLGYYCLTKITICLNHDVMFISLIFRILYCLNQHYLPMFMLSMVNIGVLRPFNALVSCELSPFTWCKCYNKVAAAHPHIFIPIVSKLVCQIKNILQKRV